MSTAAQRLATPGLPWPVQHGDPFALPQRLAAGVDPATVSRYGDSRWVFNALGEHGHSAGISVNWDTFPASLREPLRRAGWVLVNLPVPEALLDRADARRLRWQAPGTIRTMIDNGRRFAQWLAAKGITTLDQVEEDDLADYARHVKNLGLATTTCLNALYAVSRLWGAAPHLPPGDRIPVPPWEDTSMHEFLPEDGKGNENSTPPIHPAVMAPLLAWSLRFTEDFADDIIAAWQEYQRLNSCVRQTANPEAIATLKALMEHHKQKDLPLPGILVANKPGVAVRYLAARHHASEGQITGWLARSGPLPGLTMRTPMSTTITGRLHGQPWKPHINFYEAPVLMRRLSTAGLIVSAYLSGLRPGEAFGLEAGCCRVRQDTQDGPVRYELHGNFFKGARDSDGKLLPEGARRELPWTTIQPVAHAINVLERIATTPYLFPAEQPWNPSTDTSRQHRTGAVITALAAKKRIAEFIEWVNAFAREHGLGPADRIPGDPLGNVTTSRFRRTIGWHIARLPGGRIALALQYGHLRTATSAGYANRARHGLRRVLDIETARATADYLQDLADRIEAGEAVSGPAAQRMIRSARAATRFEGMFLGKAEVRALTRDPQFQVFDNPDAFLTCNKDPAKALCDPDRGTRDPTDNRPPSLDRCNPACANVARTGNHIADARAEIARLRAEASDPLTAIPLAERLRQRVRVLEAMVEGHKKTRIADGGRRGREQPDRA